MNTNVLPPLALLAQMVERCTFNAMGAGSTPAEGVTFEPA